MSPDLPATDVGEQRLPGRCPACSARVGPNDAWCTLCLHDLSAPEVPPEAPEPMVDTPASRPAPAAAEADRLAEQLLAELRVLEGGNGLPMPAALRAPAGRTAVIAGVGVAVTAALIGLSALVGWLF